MPALMRLPNHDGVTSAQGTQGTTTRLLTRRHQSRRIRDHSSSCWVGASARAAATRAPSRKLGQAAMRLL